ncbi:MAG: dockerin type I repeat-containing protein [Euryarchaeota archaeon]|nr:dockerin type I repeat-containing protein [Euryarchaeota archaeon]
MTNRLHASAVVIMVLITSTMLASACTGRTVTYPTDMAGIDMFDDRRLNRIDPTMGMRIDMSMDAGMGSTYSERFEMGSTASDGPFTHGITAGDLNGDEDDDVLIFNGTYNSSDYLTYAYDYVSAVNGRDGTELWRYDLESTTGEVTVFEVPAHPLGDLNGDGTDDVLLMVSSQNSDTGKTTATVSAIRGENGAELWSRTITGDTGYGYVFGDSTYISNLGPCDLDNDGKNDVLLTIAIYDSDTGKTTATIHAKHGDTGDDFWSQSITGTGIWMRAQSGCDLDGDDKDDVIVDCSLGITTTETTATVHAKRGYDGYEFWNQSETGEGVSALAYSTGDLDGDDKGDVLAIFQMSDYGAYNFSATMYVKHGETGANLWSQSAAGANKYMPLLPLAGCDLNGDGEGDVVITSYTGASDSGSGLTVTVHAKRGRDGHEFWSQSITGENPRMFAYPYCDFDGNGKSDVTVRMVRDHGTDENNVTVHAKHGETGDDFWSQSITGKDASLGVYAHCDLNGDDKSDAIAISEVTDPVTDETTLTVHAKRGDTGVDFWNQEATGVNITLSAYSYFDFNSDGKDDVIVESKDCDSGDENTATISVKNGETGTELWSKTVTGKGVWLANDYCNYYLSDQDFDGDDLEDLLLTTGTSVDIMYGSTEIPTSVCTVKGNTGTSLWCKPSASSEPEPSATGDLNGDGAITPADAVIVLNIIVSGNYSEDVDVNGDGVTNSLDAFMILQAAVDAIALCE